MFIDGFDQVPIELAGDRIKPLPVFCDRLQNDRIGMAANANAMSFLMKSSGWVTSDWMLGREG